jgi:hypothetical protein
LIEPAVAIKEAKRGLDRIRLEDNPGAADARAVGHAGVPVFVVRLDEPDQGYYLVPWQDRRGILLIVQVDARSGVMSSMATLQAPLTSLTISPEEAKSFVSDRLGVRVTGQPRLVWQPCRETASPFQPLYQVPVDNGYVFVTVDGTVHRRLTPFLQGGG